MSGYIPKEHLDAYRQWQMESFDSPPPEPPEPEPAMADSALDEASEAVSGFGLPTAEDIERIHNEAHQAGYQAGFEEGREEGYRAGLEPLQAQAQRIAALAENLEAALSSVDQTLADQVLALALEVAKQVVRATIVSRPETLIPAIRESLAALPIHHGHVSLHVNPAEAEIVREHLGDQFLHSGWRIVEDREIQPGGCFVRAGSSEVDATLETRWKRVLEAIGADNDASPEEP